MRPALSWLSAACLVASVAACGPSKPVGLGEVDAAAGAGDAGSGEAGQSACVRAAVQLPWRASSAPGLEVVGGTDGVAVLNRQASEMELRVYARDTSGVQIGAGTFGGDTQVLAASEGGFDVIARTDEGDDWVQATFKATLTSGTAGFAVSATATERALAAVALPTATILVTDERFINMATGASATWAVALGADAAQTFKEGRVYGLAGASGKVLLAWGAHSTLGLAVVDASGHVLAQALDDKFLGYLGAETTAAMPVTGGLLLFDGNPVRTTEIDFALARHELARNGQLKTFYRTVPRVAGITLGNRPVAFWLSVFPATDNSQGSTPHQLYACALDLADAKTCAGTSLIATTDLGGYEIAADPVAVSALLGGATFAIVHTDASDATWLRLADLSCEQPGR